MHFRARHLFPCVASCVVAHVLSLNCLKLRIGAMMQADMLPTSPRLAALSQALDAGETPAVDRFWSTVTHEGTPLIEPSPTTPDHLLVTVLWRAHDPVEHVVLISP